MIRLFAVLVLSSLSAQSQTITETFGSGVNQFSIDFVTIGNPGNGADDTGFGSVAYIYNLGKYEISRDQILKANTEGGLGITLADMTNHGGNGLNRPATGISWFEAAKFVNYLNISQGKQAAYLFDVSGNLQVWSSARAAGSNLYRHKDAYYFLASVNEWYKGAYGNFSGVWYDYPNGTNRYPSRMSEAVWGQNDPQGPADVTNAGGLSPYGTMAQGGNVWEWNENAFDLDNNDATEVRELRGGHWSSSEVWLEASARSSFDPFTENINFG
ncbi:MAG: hypothetical protein EBZ83_01585, partial [Verrucomicrobia bacterium]|nr:hypothetical protein [Verrucomicrobiota bacterium]